MARHRKKVTGWCAYCGKNCGRDNPLTEDHVIPACLWGRRAPGDAPIVYACRECNGNTKGLDDTFLRDMLVMDMQVYGHPIAMNIFEGPVLRAAKSKGYVQSPIAEMVRRNQGRTVSMQSPGGIYLGQAYGIQLPAERVWRIFSTITRGLYLAYTGAPLPDGVNFSINRVLDGTDLEPIVRGVATSGGAYRPAGDGSVFQCVFGVVPERPDVSLWFLAFYEKILWVVTTEHPDLPRLTTSRLAAAPD